MTEREFKPSFYDKNYFENTKKSNYEDYSTTEGLFYPLAKTIARVFRPRKLLEIGCAYGFFLKYLRHGLQIGIDISKYAIIERRCTNKLLLASASHLPFKSNTFDVIVSFETFEHLNRSQILNCLQDVDRVGTKWFVFTTPEPSTGYDRPDGDQSHISLLPRSEWMEICSNFNWTFHSEKTNLLGNTEMFQSFDWKVYVFNISNNNI